MAISQFTLADHHLLITSPIDLAALETNKLYPQGVTLVTGIEQGERTAGLSKDEITWLYEFCQEESLPLLIEADGSRQKPLKAPADHEPVIPDFVDTVVVVAGMSGLGKPLTDEFVHRPEIFARLSGLTPGETVTPEALGRLLTHPSGGLKNIPSGATRVALLNQADTPELQTQAKWMSEQLLSCYHAVVISSLNHQSSILNPQSTIHAVYEPVAGIILAAGEANRFGGPKQLLTWRGKSFIQHVAETALAAGLSPVVVVTGANAGAVESALRSLPVTIRHNPDWQSGQSSSIRAGLAALSHAPLPPSPLPILGEGKGAGGWGLGVGGAIFLLADQPQVTPTVLRALVERHSLDLSPIVAPLVQGQRANPVLFDRLTFPDLISLTGDVGGRAIFNKYPVTWLPWHDESLLVDVDTPGDLKKLE
jgi:molybdenum cofactor cytidylyltransferase